MIPALVLLATPSFVQIHAENLRADGGTHYLVTLDRQVDAGELLIAAITYDARPEQVSSVRDSDANTYARAFGPLDWSPEYRTELWYAQDTRGGNAPPVLDVEFSGDGGSFCQIYWSEYAGIARVAALDQIAGDAGIALPSVGIATPEVTTTSDGELVFAHAEGSGQMVLAGPGFTERSGFNGNIEQDLVQAAAGPITAGFGFTLSAPAVAIVATFRAAFADAGSPDAGSPDAGSPDAGAPDAGRPAALKAYDIACGCGAGPGPLALLALLALALGRRATRRAP